MKIIDDAWSYFEDRKCRRGNAKGCGNKGVTNQALHNVLHPFSLCFESLSVSEVSWCAWRWCQQRTWQQWQAKSISLDKTHSLHSHIHVTAPWLCKQQSRLLSLFLFLPLSILLIHTDTLRSSTITFSTNLLLLAPPPSTLSSPLRIYHHFPICLIITYIGYPWTSLMRKYVTSDSRINRNRDTLISLR